MESSADSPRSPVISSNGNFIVAGMSCPDVTFTESSLVTVSNKESGMQIIMIPISQIRVHEEYATLFPPLTPTERESLKVSIQEAGIHDPLRVERQPTDIASTQPYVVLAGHHRLSIAQELNIPEVPCIVVTTLELKVAALFDNIHRRQLSDTLRQQMQDEEKRYRTKLRERLIPELLDVLPMLPPEVQLQLTQSNHDTQRDFLSKWMAQIQQVSIQRFPEPQNNKLAAEEPDTSETPTPKGHKQLIRQINQLTKDFERQVAQQKKELEEVRQHNVSLSRQLRAQTDEKEKLHEELQSLQRQLTSDDLDHKAERILKLQRKGRSQSLTIDEAGPLISGLLHTRKTIQLLQAFAQRIATLTTPDQTTILEHIKFTSQALGELEQVLPSPTASPLHTPRQTLSVHKGLSADT